MEDQLREALKKCEETLLLFPEKPEDDKTAQAKAEIEEAIDTIQELLKEAMTPSLTEDIIMETTDHNRKRKHDLPPKRSIQERRILTEYFDSPIDFESLAQKHPEFARFVYNSRDGISAMDFTDPVGTLELTKVLLKEYYGLSWDIPVGHLVPPIPCRAKYIAWIHDLLELSSPERTPVRGLDIGCGANCIYPLLGATMYGWKFIGTDITQAAVHYANGNKDRNPEISHLIDIVKIPENCQDILSSVVQDYGHFHFCMCNPPFFDSLDEAGQNQRTAFGGTADEMVYSGGELSFVSRILEESIQLQTRIHWYTVMLGKKSTFKKIRAQLHEMSIDAIRTSTLMQGKITRWTIAWSFAAKNTNDKPLRLYSTVSSRVYSLPSLGRPSRDLIQCLCQIIEAHGASVVSQSETRLTVQLPRHQKNDFTLEVLPEGTKGLVVLLPEKTPIPQELFQKLWEDVKILWSN